MAHKLMIEEIYGIETCIDPSDYGVPEYETDTPYHRIVGAFDFPYLNITGHGSLIGTEKQLATIMKGIALSFNTLANNTVYFQWDNIYEPNLEKLKIKATYCSYAIDGADEDIDEEEADPKDYNYFFIIDQIK